MSLSLASFWKACTCMSDLRESINIGTTSHSFQSPEKEKRKENTWEKTPKTCFLKNKQCWNYFAVMYLMKYLFGLKLINTSERVTYFTKIAGTRATTNKRQLSMKYQQQNVRFGEKSKQNHRKSPIFRLTLRLFRAGKQRNAGKQQNRNKGTHLEKGFLKILTKNMFSFHLKKCFCCHDKRNLLNSNRFHFEFCA